MVVRTTVTKVVEDPLKVLVKEDTRTELSLTAGRADVSVPPEVLLFSADEGGEVL